jgi:putative flippase GtrA
MNPPFLNSQLGAHSSKLIAKPLCSISPQSPAQHNPLTRFLRFNLVGLLGIALQLATLAMLNRAIPAHYLLTSTLAVELTLLHNFILHLHYTWPETASPLTALLRFHLSNGLISLAGNLALMHLFVHSLHAPILLANALTIAICGLANFLLAHHWAFAIPQPKNRPLKTTNLCLDKS